MQHVFWERVKSKISPHPNKTRRRSWFTILCACLLALPVASGCALFGGQDDEQADSWNPSKTGGAGGHEPTSSDGDGGAGGADEDGGSSGDGGVTEDGGADGGGGSDGGGGAEGGLPEGVNAEYCADTAGWDLAWAEKEEEILRLVNERRAKGANCGGNSYAATHPLTMNAALQCAARMHSLDMAERDFFAHETPEGENPGDRLRAAGFVGRGWGENIAGGNGTAAATMEQWMNSTGHCQNIMSPDFDYIGVGYVAGPMHLWTQTFGR
jgi:hypothetical protein